VIPLNSNNFAEISDGLTDPLDSLGAPLCSAWCFRVTTCRVTMRTPPDVGAGRPRWETGVAARGERNHIGSSHSGTTRRDFRAHRSRDAAADAAARIAD
jgi:hypothetical protein